MRAFRLRTVLKLTAFTCLISAAGVMAGELYRTEFEPEDGFAAGEGSWVGADGWVGINTSGGGQGIDLDVIPGGGLGQSASIGFSQPVMDAAGFPTLFVGKPIGYHPQPGELPVVEVQTIVGIQDSTPAHPARDSFFVSVWNGSGNILAAVRFSNQPSSYGIWRNDGTAAEQDTGVIFYRGELHLLTMRVDLPNNRWSADLDGIPLFVDATLNATGEPVDFGYLGYEWQLSAMSPAGHGDNWMMVADVIVRSTGRGVLPFRVSRFECNGTGTVLEWPGENGFDYQVEYSTDGETWHDSLPGSSFPGITTEQVMSFTDPSATVGLRFYRVNRADTP